MMWFFRHFWIFISYHIFLLNQVEGAIAIPPSNSAPLPLFRPSVCLSICPSIGLLTTFSGFCTFADKSLGRNGIELEMQMFPDDLPLANIDADGYCCHFMRSSVRPTIHGLGFVYCIQSAWKKWPTIWHADVSRWLTLSIQYTCGYGGGDICCHYWQHILVQYGILPDMVLHGRSMYGHWMAYPQDEVTLAMFTNHKVFLISLFVDVELLVIWHVTMQHPGNHTTGIFMGCCKMLMWFHCNDDVRLTPLPWSSSFFHWVYSLTQWFNNPLVASGPMGCGH